jgi:signal peptidase I
VSRQTQEVPPSKILEDEIGTPIRKKSVVREYTEAILVIVAVALLLRTFVVHAYRIPSSSMEDTLLIGDFLLANRFVYGAPIEVPFTGITLGRLPALSEPKHGDILIFASWADTTEDFIKRCVGLPGDTILVRNNVLTVNGRSFDDMLKERFGDDMSVFPEVKYSRFHRRRVVGIDPANYGPHVVPAGHLFMMGDNRDFSSDSRFNGDVPMRRLKARAIVIYMSLDTNRPGFGLLTSIRWNRIGRLIH